MRKSKVQAALNRADADTFMKTADYGHNRGKIKQLTVDIIIVVGKREPKQQRHHNKSNLYSMVIPKPVLLSPQKAVA